MTAIFRCDATTETGFGHLSRCIALAEAFLLSAIHSSFAGLFDPAARDQIIAGGFGCLDFAEPVNSGGSERQALSAALKKKPDSFVVVDSYRADEAYLSDLRQLGSRTVVIDDFKALAAYPCDVVMNFTWEAPALVYPEGPALLLGPQYLPARRRLVELRQQSISRDRGGTVSNLLIAIGGSDPKSIAARLVRLLRERNAGLCLRVIAANDGDLVGGLDEFLPGSRILPRQPDLSEQLLWADACITGGGLIKYESAFMGVPAAAVSQNDGQARETRVLTGAGLVFDLGLADDRSDEQLGEALEEFLSHDALRGALGERARKAFPSDPSVNAATAIAKALGL